MCKSSTYNKQLLGEFVVERSAELEPAAADRCPRELGTFVRVAEVQSHHEVTNQYLRSQL